MEVKLSIIDKIDEAKECFTSKDNHVYFVHDYGVELSNPTKKKYLESMIQEYKELMGSYKFEFNGVYVDTQSKRLMKLIGLVLPARRLCYLRPAVDVDEDHSEWIYYETSSMFHYDDWYRLCTLDEYLGRWPQNCIQLCNKFKDVPEVIEFVASKDHVFTASKTGII